MLNWSPIESIYIFSEMKYPSSSWLLLFTPAVSFNKGNQYVSPHHSILWKRKSFTLTEDLYHLQKVSHQNSETAVLSRKEPEINCSKWCMLCTYIRRVLRHVASHVLCCDTVTLVVAVTLPNMRAVLRNCSKDVRAALVLILDHWGCRRRSN